MMFSHSRGGESLDFLQREEVIRMSLRGVGGAVGGLHRGYGWSPSLKECGQHSLD